VANYRVGPAGTLEPLLTRLLPDELWSIAQSVLPAPKFRPQGGGRGRVDERATFTAILYVLTIGCAWRRLPKEFGTCPTAYRRFNEGCQADVWSRWIDAVVKTIDDPAMITWTKTVVTPCPGAGAHARDVIRVPFNL
jgi:transposase